jgi:hypothetical protein
VLLRYYEFLFPIVSLGGLVVWQKGLGEKVNVFFRWGLFLAFSLLLTPAFTGFFGTLTVQIADAPTLAGLIVNADVFNATAVIGMIALLVFATFPKYTAWAYLALIPVTFVGTGWQIQDQYQGFRGSLSAADKAGQYLRENLTSEDLESTLILANSRFDATNVAIWADNPSVTYDLVAPGTLFPESAIPSDKEFIVLTGDVALEGGWIRVTEGEGFSIFSRSEGISND